MFQISGYSQFVFQVVTMDSQGKMLKNGGKKIVTLCYWKKIRIE